MNGCNRLSEYERQELLEDARNVQRKRAFLSARTKTQTGTFDDYVDFLSEVMPLFASSPRKTITDNFRL